MTPAATTPLLVLPVAVLDSETTGLDATTARLVQLAAVHVLGDRIEPDGRFETLVRPNLPIPPRSTAVHGITDRDVAAAPAAVEAIPALLSFVGSRVVVGHTITYDLEVLKREAARAKLPWRQPRALDVRLLARLVAPRLADYGLDALCAWLGFAVEGRHRAMGDALATARVFTTLVPLLRQAGVRTLAEAETASRLVGERDAVAAGEPNAELAPPAGEDLPAQRLVRIDSYPFSHRVAEAMSTPPISLSLENRLADAVALLIEHQVSSVFLIGPDRERGIVTERDVLRTLASRGAAALETPLHEIWSHPLHCVRSDDFVYRAIGRTARLGIRHLGVVDDADNLVGALTTRQLLRHRTSEAIALGDEIAAATDAAGLSAAWAKLPTVAAALSAEAMRGRPTAEVISAELRMLTRRAAQLGEARMAEQGRGPPPVAYAVLVLGSAGRGESLLAADQDNAIVYADGSAEGPEDNWFAEMASHMADILDQAGVPYCRGGVMAKNAPWRGSFAAWQARVDAWIGHKRPEDLLNVDIFFDAVAVHGQTALAEELLAYAYLRGSQRPAFWQALGETLLGWRSPVGTFGGLRTDPGGRLDLKRSGLFPLLTAARIVAIRTGSPTYSTPDRLRVAPVHDLASPDTVERLIDAHGVIIEAILNQQSADSLAGIAPSSRVDPKTLGRLGRAALVDALRQIPHAIDLVREGML